jgi:hypothetical protein
MTHSGCDDEMALLMTNQSELGAKKRLFPGHVAMKWSLLSAPPKKVSARSNRIVVSGIYDASGVSSENALSPGSQ